VITDYLTNLLRNSEVPQHVIVDYIQEVYGKVAKVWVVYGESGSHSDHKSWTVAAFLDKDQAKAFRDKLNNWCKENFILSNVYGSERDERGSRMVVERNLDYDKFKELLGDEPKCPLDDQFQHVYDGVSYDIWEMPLKSDL
jgi:hypothetical protein